MGKGGLFMIDKELILREFGKTHNKGKKPYGAMKHLLNYGSITISDLQGYHKLPGLAIL